MKSPRSFQSLAAAVCLGAGITSSDAITMELANVGNADNTADATGFGAVAYDYAIGRYEVTNSQYTSFLNAVAATDTYSLYSTFMDSDARGGISQSGSSGSYKYSPKTNMGDKPVNYVSWFDAARFSNWMANGQTTGEQVAATTERGAYTLNGARDGIVLKTPGAAWYIPSQDEWYKAAYYSQSLNGGAGGYWDYPTQSNSEPTVATADVNGNISNPGSNVANYDYGVDWNDQEGNVSTVGSAGTLSASFYGTSDQAGNVFEWNDAVIGSSRGLCGGSWNYSVYFLKSSLLTKNDPANEYYDVGFRVVSVPEPSTVGLMLMAGAAGMVWKRRKSSARSLSV